MNRRIRWLGIVLVVCFALLFLQLNNLQVRRRGARSSNMRRCTTRSIRTCSPRGKIYSSDGVVLAYSKPTHDGYKYLRIYPQATAKLFAGVTGYESVAATNATGLELEYNQFLASHNAPITKLGQLILRQKITNNVTVTVSYALQQVAAEALAGRTGSVVAIDPRTGAVLAMYGNPTFDPNLFAVHSYNAVNRNYEKLAELAGRSPASTIRPRSRRRPARRSRSSTRPPSTTRSRARADRRGPPVRSIVLPQTNGLTLQNFGGEYCPTSGTDLAAILLQSCDTSFALIGKELGAEKPLQRGGGVRVQPRTPARPAESRAGRTRRGGEVELPAHGGLRGRHTRAR